MEISPAFLVILSLLVVVPLLVQIFFSPRYIERIRAAIAAGDTRARIRMYRIAMSRSWLLAVACVAALYFAGFSLEEQGFTGIEQFGGAVYVLITMVLVLGVPVLIAAFRPPEDVALVGDIEVVIPRTAEEGRWYTGAAITAGITEEITNRALPILLLAYLLPGDGWLLPVVLAAVIFGVAHLYQGFTGVVATFLLGLLLGYVYVETRSLIPVMVAHVLIDLRVLLLPRPKTAVAQPADGPAGSSSTLM